MHFSWQVSFFIAILSFIAIINSSYAYGITNEARIEINAPFSIAINPNTNIVYVEHPDVTFQQGIISVINGSSNNSITDIQTNLPQSSIVLNPVTNMLYFGYTNVNDYIAVINGSTNKIVNSIQIFQQAPHLTINPSTNKLYVTDYEDDHGIIDVIDGFTNNVTKVRIPNHPFTIEVNPSTNKLYLGVYTGNQTGLVYEIDGSTHKIVDKIPMPYDSINGLMVNPRTNFLYVADGGHRLLCDSCRNECQNGFVHIIDLTTKKFIANSTVVSPGSFSINPNTGTVYVSSSAYCRTTTALDGNSGKVLYTISNSTWAVVNPITNRVYLSHYYDNNISVFSDVETKSKLNSPWAQFKSGISTNDIKCDQGFVLIIKNSDNSPACVKPQTAQKLVERGWGVLKEQMVWFVYNPIECQLTPWAKEFANITMSYIPERMKIDEYFKDQGITIFDARELIYLIETHAVNCASPLNKESPNKESTNGVFYYFLVSTSDTDKMTSLGYKKVNNVPTYAKSVK